jgi:UDP-N-acetylglucosamine 2-epimerase (non-hydrolysing)/GDP/UDP-N,N'-diacetylbacillosamine 2-epimerase (hydrolysing)
MTAMPPRAVDPQGDGGATAPRRIAVVTTTRADYGLLRETLIGMADDRRLHPLVVAAGMHLSEDFGSTVTEIEADGVRIDAKVSFGLPDERLAAAREMGTAVRSFADAFAALRPEALLVLGDRFEILAAAYAALLLGIPIAHVHGGESTEGAFDDCVRHALTKLSQYHFVAAEPYRQRVIRMGEAPDRVWTVGAPGLDAAARMGPVTDADVARDLGVPIHRPLLLVTYHPVTLGSEGGLIEVGALLGALDAHAAGTIVLTSPNADPGHGPILEALRAWVARDTAHRIFRRSLGHAGYLRALTRADAVVGNSSSGILEAPYFRVPTVNIGDRQRGRLKAVSVLDCEPTTEAIATALRRALDGDFRKSLPEVCSVYGSGGAASAIVERLATVPLAPRMRKPFFDGNGLLGDSSDVR